MLFMKPQTTSSYFPPPRPVIKSCYSLFITFFSFSLISGVGEKRSSSSAQGAHGGARTTGRSLSGRPRQPNPARASLSRPARPQRPPTRRWAAYYRSQVGTHAREGSVAGRGNRPWGPAGTAGMPEGLLRPLPSRPLPARGHQAATAPT